MCVFLGAICASAGASADHLRTAARTVYSLSIVPQFSATVIAENWTPVVEILGREGVPLELHLHKSIPAFEKDFLEGGSDFIFANPYHAVMAYRAQGYIPLVKNSVTSLKGILVVRRDSSLRSLKELDGQPVAFPAPNAFGASLYMRALLADAKVRIKPVYVGNHANAYRRVLTGEFAAAGGIASTLAEESDAVQAQLRVLYETPPTAPHPVMAHPRVPLAVREKLIQALMRMGADPTGGRMLENTQLGLPGLADYQRDYAPLERLGLRDFVVLQP